MAIMYPSHLVVCTLLAASPLAAQAGPVTQTRVELAIRPVTLSESTRRYAVAMTVGGVAIDAGLDTGSTGLRVLEHGVAQAQFQSTSQTSHYSYTSGVRLSGVIAKAPVAFGAMTGDVPFALVRTADCVQAKPRCPASQVDAAKFGIQGDGLPGEGFVAILGTNMGNDAAPNPLMALGVKRWIVDLPRPGEGAGRLVLNPTAEETADYIMLPIDDTFADRDGGLHDAIAGCLSDKTTNRTICGPTLLDSGAPGVRIVTPTGEAAWANGDAAQIVFVKDGKPAIGADFGIGRREQASRFTAETNPNVRSPQLYPGIMPYFVFSVLYDAEHHQIGLRARDRKS